MTMNHVENRSIFTLTINFPTEYRADMHTALSKATRIISEGALQGRLSLNSGYLHGGVIEAQWTTGEIDTESSDPNPSDPLSEEVQALRVALTSLSSIFN